MIVLAMAIVVVKEVHDLSCLVLLLSLISALDCLLAS
jgi:hypothetical protein